MYLKISRYALAGIAFGSLVLASAFPVKDANAQGQVVYDLDSNVYAGEFVVPLNKSRVLRVTRPFSELRVGNPDVADVLPLTTQNVYILGKTPGSTSLSILASDRTPVAVVDLMVSYDTEGIKRRLYDVMPTEQIEVRGSADSVVLSGTVSGADNAANAQAIADSFAPGKVTNLLQVRGSQQVMLAVRFAEVKRSIVKELGLNVDATLTGNDANITFGTGRLKNPDVPEPFGDIFGVIGLTDLAVGDLTLEAVLDALEDKGVVKTLAEPNLIALSGETANFLAGGEFPVPVAQSDSVSVTTGQNGDDGSAEFQGGATTIEFKEFGVSLAFTPTVIGEDLVNLKVSPEVSSLDFSVARRVGQALIPGLTTRRAKTTVELRDGQSFAIAGLLQNDFSDNIRSVPFLGDLPIIGALFRSTQYQKGETELVIVVTPHLVTPAAGPDQLALPTDNFVPPDELSLFLLGRTEGWTSGKPQAQPESKEGAIISSAPQQTGGLDGNFGHIIQ
jgi:pilus assembly protein CpaC